MTELPLISVIIPAYNVGQYLEKCISSILQQTYKNTEVIIVDDGSTDNTLAVANSFSFDPRVKTYRKDNGGVSSTRNFGLSASSGKYIVFVDGDDFISPFFIEHMYQLVSKDNCDFALSTLCFMKQGEKQTKTVTHKVVSSSECSSILLNPDVIVGCWNKIFKKNFLDQNNILFNENLFYGEGLKFILTCSTKAKNVGVTNEKLYYYRRNNSNSATSVYKLDKIINGESSLISIKEIIGNDASVTDVWLMHMCMFYVGAICQLLICKEKKNYIACYKNWRQFLKHNLSAINHSKCISFKRKMIISLCRYFPYITSRLYLFKRRAIVAHAIE